MEKKSLLPSITYEKCSLERTLRHELQMLAEEMRNYYNLLLTENQQGKQSSSKSNQIEIRYIKTAIKRRKAHILAIASELLYLSADEIEEDFDGKMWSGIPAVLCHPAIRTTQLHELCKHLGTLEHRLSLLETWNRSLPLEGQGAA